MGVIMNNKSGFFPDMTPKEFGQWLEKENEFFKNDAHIKAEDNNTRRKLIIGEMYLQQMKKDKAFNIQVLNQLDFYLNKQRDRDLFKIDLDEYKEAIPNGYKPSFIKFFSSFIKTFFTRLKFKF